MDGKPNKSMDVRAKQRLCFLACLFSLKLRGGGFAPRHLSRSASLFGSVSDFMLCFVTVPKTQYLSAFCERQI